MRIHALTSRSARRTLGVVAAAVVAVALTASPGLAHRSASVETEAVIAAEGGGNTDPLTVMAKTVKANPGSKQIAKNVIQLDEGIIMVLPTGDGKSPQAASDCPSGWQCAWPDVNFGGAMLAAQRCVYLDYTKWYFWNSRLGAWDDYAYDVTSVFNNIPGVTWSQFWSPRNGANFNARLGAPAAYVGDKWNDSFTAAQGCSGQAG